MKRAFTLAKVLITLAIIGIVAAITIPTLIQNYEKKVTSTKLKKFNAIMSEAILLNNSEYGNNSWIYTAMQNMSDYSESFYENHLNNKIVASRTESKFGGSSFYVGLQDGSGFTLWRSMLPPTVEAPFYITYCPNYDYCLKNGRECYDGRNGFLFQIEKSGVFNTYCSVNMDRNALLKQCKVKESKDHNKSHCCSALLKKDNWEIKEDYPWTW